MINGRFRVEGKLPSGPSNFIYVANDTQNDCRVVIKTFASIEIQKIIGEKKDGLLGLISDYIPRVYEVGEFEGEFCLIEQFVEGKSLNQYLADHDLTYQDFFSVFDNLIDATGELHRHGFVHGDIKPQNILIKENEGKIEAILIDIDSAFMHEKKNVVFGSLSYCAPEQIVEGVYPPEADIYALAMVAYYLIERKRPVGVGKKELLNRVTGSNELKLATIKERFTKTDLELLLNEMTNIDPMRRPSLETLKKRLHSISDRIGDENRLGEMIGASKSERQTEITVNKTYCRTFDFPAEFMGISKEQENEQKNNDVSLGIYRKKLMQEYDNIDFQASIAFWLWVATFFVGVGIILLAVIMICNGKYQEAILTTALESLIYFAQKHFALREEYYRKQNDSKLKHLEVGDYFEYAMGVVDASDPKYVEKKVEWLLNSIDKQIS